MNLNKAQCRAVEHTGGPLLVLAGPGTGKTRVIIARVAHMIAERGVEPEQILALTFTNKAAGELRQRLAEEVGFGVAERLTAMTFHGYGLRVIRRFADRLGLPAMPTLVDSSQRRTLLRDLALTHGVFANLAHGGVDAAVGRSQDTIAQLRNAGVSMEDAVSFCINRADALRSHTGDDAEAELAEVSMLAEAARLGAHFEQVCAQRGWLTFDDLIRLPTELLARDQQAASMVRTDCRHIVVDEFQDVNQAQIDLLMRLAPPGAMCDLCVVGDDDQSIYAFRGADERAIARFGAVWRGHETVLLEENYRSEQPIIDAGNAIIARAGVRYDDSKVIRRPEGDEEQPDPDARVELIRLENQLQSGEVIAQLILADRARDPGKPWSDYAVIGRTHGELSRVRAALTLDGVPVVSGRAPSPLDDAGVQDVLAWVELFVEPQASWAARRVLARPPFAVSAPALSMHERNYRRLTRDEPDAPEPFVAWLARTITDDDPNAGVVRRFAALWQQLGQVAGIEPADKAIAEIVRRTGAAHADLLDGRARAARVSALVAVLRFAAQRVDRLDQPRDVGAFWRYYSELDDSEQQFGADAGDRVEPHEESGLDEDEPGVRLITAHTAKGLEFDTVFVPRVNSPSGFPTKKKSNTPPLPFGLVDRVGDERSIEARRDDEERRLFYVACTRAERRLVLMSKLPAKKSSTTNYVIELLELDDAIVRDADDVLGSGGRDAVERLTLEYRGRIAAREAIEDARRRARLDASAALAMAEDESADFERVDAALRSAARRLGVAAHIERTGDAPAWAADAGLGGAADELARVVRAGKVDPATEPSFAPMRPPLELSYSKISAYLACPRCFYLRHVLGMPEEPNPNAALGTALHAALCSFYTRWRDADSEGLATPGEGELLELGQREAKAARLEPAQLSQVRAQLGLVWGAMHDPAAHVTDLELAFRLPYECKDDTHIISGKIDRVDQTGGGVRVIDYKSGHPSKKMAEPPRNDLQMGIYAMAVRALREDPDLGGVCEYWLLADGSVGRIGFDQINEPKVREAIDNAISGMLAGRFAKGKGCKGGMCSVLDPV